MYSDVLVSENHLKDTNPVGPTGLPRQPGSIFSNKTAITFNKMDRHRSYSASSFSSSLSTFLLFHCTFFQRTCYLRYAEAPTTGIAAVAAALLPVKYGEKLAAAATAAADSAEDDT